LSENLIVAHHANEILSLRLLHKDFENLREKNTDLRNQLDQLDSLMMRFISVVIVMFVAIVGFLIQLIRTQNKSEKSNQ